MLGILKKILGDKSTKDIKEIQPHVDKTIVEFAKLSGLSNDQLRNKTLEFKQRINDYIKTEIDQIDNLKSQSEKEGVDILQTEQIYDDIDKLEKSTNEKIEEILIEILPEAFAVIKETAKRFTENDEIEVSASDFDKELAEKHEHITIKGDNAIWQTEWVAGGVSVKWNMIHYDVQLIGGTALHQGKIAEMQTGEGKTLVATLPVYLNALAGRGVHLITVNDYLAKRDAEWMGPIYEFHGLSVDCIDKHQPNSEERRKAYNADITFGTNNEFGFDYLRDNMAQNPDLLVQRKHYYAIVDEVDSVLIDDARTPLIISGPTDKEDKHEYFNLKPKVEQLVNNQRKLVTDLLVKAKKQLKGLDKGETSKEDLTEGGVALLQSFRGLPKNKALIKFLNEHGVKSHLQKTENYHLQDSEKEMRKIDQELYFVIDEKSNAIDLTDKGIDLISGKEDPDFFIMPDLASELSLIEKGSGSEDEIKTKKEELIRDYTIKADRIHTLNQLLKAYTLFEMDVEYVVVENKVKIVDEQTGRIMEGRRYSDGLHQAIEAKEKVTVEAATQTYATVTLQNYFRMYHKLAGMTGTAETEAQELWDIYKLDVIAIPTNRHIVRDDRQDLVFRTKREKYNAVIEQITKEVEKGRPVLVGTTSVEISELLGKMLTMKNIKHNVLNAKLHKREADIVAEAGMKGIVTIATNMAGRGTDIKLSQEVIAAGGLAIIGTERHDSRRVDRQLRGRAGRQGDPGSSQFFVSLEDNLMRLFGSERITKLMDRVGFKEGEVIQHGMISKSIERAQKKVEENNFGIRKRLLEYDDVMNAQREVIYKKRKHALYGERLSVDISNMFYESVSAIVNSTKNGQDYDGFKMDLLTQYSMECPVDEVEFNTSSIQDITDKIYDKVYSFYKEKTQKIGEQAMPLIKDLYENKKGQYKDIRIPFSDGIKSIAPLANLEKAYNNQGQELAISLEKGVTLALIDDQWKNHLREMDDLRQSVQLVVHEQKDPLLIYKFESFELFRKMVNQMNQEVASFLTKAHLPEGGQNENVGRTIPTQQQEMASYETSKEEAMQTSGGGAQPQGPGAPPKRKPMVKQMPKIGRNDKVEIMNIQTYEKKTLKFKQAEPLLKSGVWQIVN